MISEKIKSLRKKHGLSRRHLGLLLGVSTNSIWLWETGNRRPSWPSHILLSYVSRDLKNSVKKESSRGR
ncbi:MAG: helix-turn-helix transcriptional regulator [Syntrophorhabdus sp.]|nr:helix-turn-helix transcriptional regulator [Syntrophorhabdus sp.]